MKIIRLHLIFLLVLFSLLPIYSQVEVETDLGNIYRGLIIENNDTIVKVKSLDDLLIDIPKDKIKRMDKVTAKIDTYDGMAYTGTFRELNDSTIYFSTIDKVEVKLLKSDIYKIEFINNIFKTNYPMLGLTYGDPGGLNALFGYRLESLGLRGEIGYIPSNYLGIQMNFLYNITTKKVFEQNLSLGIGYWERYDVEVIVQDKKRSVDKTRAYFGIMYDVNIYGFFGEAGLTIGNGNYSNPIFTSQIGYVYRFNN